MKVGIGIIGAGFVGDIHAEALVGVHDVDMEIVAVAATSLTSALAFADKHAIPNAFVDYRRALERDDI